jgi:hypothetical protein
VFRETVQKENGNVRNCIHKYTMSFKLKENNVTPVEKLTRNPLLNKASY